MPPKPQWSEEQFVEAALRIADAEGLDALTMRRLAAEFGSSAMAMYRHVKDKDTLLELIAESVIAAVPELDRDADWQSELARFFTAWHHRFLEHPAAAHIMARRSLAVPSVIGYGEAALVLLLDAGFDDATAVAALVALGSYTLGASLYELSRKDGLHRIREVGIDPAENPTIHRMRDQIASAASDDQFRFGLDRLLRGIAAQTAA